MLLPSESFASAHRRYARCAHTGAYFARHLNEAKEQGRITKVTRDPLLSIKAFCDLGGTGAKSDAFAVWIAQFAGRNAVHILDYYEAVGQPLAAHIEWLRDSGWGKAQIYLPHDGATHDRIYDVSFESAFRSAGFPVEVIPNQGRGAAKMRIEAARRLFPSVWFNEETTEAGRDALGWYHEKKSEDIRDVGLGPEHDWSSNGSDAFGLLCVAYEMPQGRPVKLKYKEMGIV